MCARIGRGAASALCFIVHRDTALARLQLDVPRRLGRIFRCSTFMAKLLEPRHGPRDITKLSPRHHDDFERGALSKRAYHHEERIELPRLRPTLRDWSTAPRSQVLTQSS